MSRPSRLRFGSEDRGVASVVGAIIVIALLVAVLVKVQVDYVPVWDHDSEADLMDAMVRDLAYLKTDMDRQVGNQTSSSITDQITLGAASGMTFFEGGTTPGSLTFTPGGAGEGATLGSNRLTIESQSGLSLQSLQTYGVLASGVVATGIVNLEALHVRLDNPFGAGNGSTVRLDFADANNRCAAQLLIRVTGPTGQSARNFAVGTYPGQSSNCTATLPTPAHLRDTIIGCATCINPAYFFVDTLDPDLSLGALLLPAKTPLTLTVTKTGSPAPVVQRILVFDQAVAGGTNRVGAGGYVASNYSTIVSAGTLVLQKDNNRFPSQIYTLEHGAVLIEQEGEVAMLVPPVFRVFTTSSQARIEWVLPAMTGTANHVGGSQAAAVTSTPTGGRTELSAIAPRLTFQLTTENGEVWKSFWDQSLAANGFIAGTHYTSNFTNTSAALDFFGPVGGPADLNNDILLNLAVSPLNISIRSVS